MTTHTLPPEVKLSQVALDAAYDAIDRLPLRDFNASGTELDILRKREGARAAIIAYLSALEPSGEGVGAEPRLLEQLYGDRPPSTKQTYRDAAMRMIEDATLPGTGDMTYPTVRDLDLAEAFASAIEAASLFAQPLTGMEGAASPDDLRARGFSVAVHNDYRLDGVPHTFWLVTHADGTYLKGEGKTDAEALNLIRSQLSTTVSAASPEGEARAAVKPLTTSEIEKIILTTEVPELSDRGDRVWTRRMATALCNRQFSIPVPEGFVLVPVEPTETMIEAGIDALREHTQLLAIQRDPLFVWRYMLAAVPSTQEKNRG